jgi:methylglutaconyl-CoA hydratase
MERGVRMTDGLHLETVDAALTATIRSGEGNLFTAAMMDDLVDAVTQAGADEAVRFVRIRAEGDTFCMGRQKAGTSADELRAMAARIPRVNETLRTSPLTILAEVNGPAAGFGVGLAAASDIVVVSERATFAFPEILAGFAPAVVLSWARFVVPARLLYDMVSTGQVIDARRAVEAGIATEVVAHQDLQARVDERIARLASVDGFALREMKRFLVTTRTMDPAQAAAVSVDHLAFSAMRVVGNF